MSEPSLPPPEKSCLLFSFLQRLRRLIRWRTLHVAEKKSARDSSGSSGCASVSTASLLCSYGSRRKGRICSALRVAKNGGDCQSFSGGQVEALLGWLTLVPLCRGRRRCRLPPVEGGGVALVTRAHPCRSSFWCMAQKGGGIDVPNYTAKNNCTYIELSCSLQSLLKKGLD